jgi:hypothetical protein
MYKRILAALFLAFTLGAVCPAPATATSTPRAEWHHRRYRRHRHIVVVIRAFPGNSN